MLSDPNAGMAALLPGQAPRLGHSMLAMKLQQLFEIARPK